jgi:rubrerythrin
MAKDALDNEILRVAIIAELDAVNLYEQMAALTENEHIKTVLLDVAKEEKAHVGEFQALLLMTDKQQEKELSEGKKEVEELIR